MEDTIVSKASMFYYAKAVGAIFAVIMVWFILIYHAIVNQETGGALLTTILLCGASLIICYYYLSANFFKITVQSTNILIKYYLTKKERIIEYKDIAEVNTYRSTQESVRSDYIPKQSFLIELNNGKSIGFSYGDYVNYDDLKSAIYKYKLGIGL